MLNEIDLSRADLNLLVLFEVVLETRHVGRAAGMLRLSPSAVSHGLGRLRRMFNDPLFLKTPKGVVPTARATELAEPIADILARTRGVLATVAPFEAAQSRRRFTIGAPDAISAVILPPLMAHLGRAAPRIDLSVRQLLPQDGGWQAALALLDERSADAVVLPLDEVPARFAARVIYEEDFVIAMRAGHRFAASPSLDRYCEQRHLVTSQSDNPFALVDRALEAQGRSRRVALTVPNFMMAVAILAETDFVAALPRRFVARHAARFRLTSVEAPLPLDRSRIRVIAPKVAMMDAGVAWLFDAVAEAGRTPRDSRAGKR